MEGKFPAVFLTCLMASVVSALEVKIPETIYEHARGDNITLPCSFKSKFPAPPMVIISWSLEGTQANAKEILILTHYSNPVRTDIKSIYEGRVKIDVDVKTGKANLKLSSITLADNKQFECRVMIPGDDEGKPAATTRLVVLVAPSTPICKIVGEAVYGQDIKLTCHSEEGSPPPVYKWKSNDVRNLPRDPRAPATRSEEKAGVLSLFNITRETSGYYTCTSSNKIRSAMCNITLSVMPQSMNVGSTAGIIVGVAVPLIIIIIVVYCCCCRKKKDKQEEYVMGVQEDKNHSEAVRNGDKRRTDEDEEASVRMTSDRDDRYADGSESGYRGEERERRRDYDDRRSDYDDRRSDYDDRRSDYDDRRRVDNDDRRRGNDEPRSDYDDRPREYDDRRSDYTEPRDRNDRYDEEADRRYDEPYDDRDKPPVPSNKPRRRDYED